LAFSSSFPHRFLYAPDATAHPLEKMKLKKPAILPGSTSGVFGIHAKRRQVRQQKASGKREWRPNDADEARLSQVQ
jgi:hypothetical protein